MLRILTEPKNAVIKQYQKLFELDGVDLTFEEEALREIVAVTMSKGTGARGLRSVLESFMVDFMFDIPSSDEVKEITVTREMVLNHKQPKMEVHEAENETKKRA